MNRPNVSRLALALLGGLALVGGGYLYARGSRRTPPPPPARRVSPPTRTAPADAGPPPRPLEAAPAPAPPRLFRMDPQHTGRSGFRLPSRLRVSASRATGGRLSTQFAVSRGGELLVPSHDGTLHALDAESFNVRWRFATGDRIYSAPLVLDSGSVYFGTDADRFLQLTPRGSLELALGTEDDADTAPVPAVDGSLRFAAGRTLYATDSDLTVRWRLDFGGKVFSSPAMLPDGTAVVGCQDDRVYAVAPDGTVRWSYATRGDVDASPAIDSAGTVYVGSDDGSLYALDGATGALRWSRALGGFVRAGVALGLDGNLVVGTYGPNPRVVAVDRASGEVRWSVPVQGPPTQDFGVASAALVDRDGRYAVGTPDDRVLVLERDGAVRASVSLPADVDTPPVLLEDGVLAVGCDDGRAYRLTE